MVKHLPAKLETWVWSLGWEDPLEKGMATHSSILAWRIPWAEGPGGLQFMGSQRVGQDWVTFTFLFYLFSYNSFSLCLYHIGLLDLPELCQACLFQNIFSSISAQLASSLCNGSLSKLFLNTLYSKSNILSFKQISLSCLLWLKF